MDHTKERLNRWISILLVLIGISFLITNRQFNIYGNFEANYFKTATVDTTLTMCSPDEEEVFDFVNPLFVDLNDFSTFVKERCGRPLNFQSEELIDTTGDGQKELVRTSVTMNEHGCHIRNSIRRNGELIWEDEMTIDDRYGAYLFGGKENYQRFYPYSAFYLGMVNAPFLDELQPGHYQYDLRKKSILNELAGTQDTDLLNEYHHSGLARYMDQYKGKYVFSLDMASRDIYIWDPVIKVFVPIYLS